MCLQPYVIIQNFSILYITAQLLEFLKFMSPPRLCF